MLLAGRDASTYDLWNLVWGRPEVDPADLAQAIERELRRDDLDYRTRLLIRDSLNALERFWGADRWLFWLEQCPMRTRIEAILNEDLGEPGFQFGEGRLMPATEPEAVKEYLREMGTSLPEPARLPIGGAIALILTGYIRRATEDIDVVDEVPTSIRSQRKLLARLKANYHLRLTHFASHYLPVGWASRLRSLGTFGKLDVHLVDPIDVFLGKLFSDRSKDRGDLRAMKPNLDKDLLIRRLQTTTGPLLRDPKLRAHAEQNWYILYGESLPTPPPEDVSMTRTP